MDIMSKNLKAVIFFFFLFIIFSLFIYSYGHTLFVPFLPCPVFALFLSPRPPSLPGRTCSSLFSNFVEEYT
jgi:hypothetical protein